ncbi:DUF1861 family protein [Sporolactobacillus sp. THM7-4]|nr:DUF1861 family protein [Sporolactobacillus sp. THM7-4]
MDVPRDSGALLEADEKNKRSVITVEKLKFIGVKEKDIYNITAPFYEEARSVIAGRVESRENEESYVAFFEYVDGNWRIREDMPTFPLQDPFITKIDGQLIFGGVKVLKGQSGQVTWRTVLYRGESVRSLVPFFEGPIGMKDLRLAQLENGKVLVLTRPLGQKGGRGKIGYLLLSSLDELDVKKLEEAPLLDGQFSDEEWGGANEIHLLKNGHVGVLGHIAHFDEYGHRHYYSMIFTLDPQTGSHTPIEVIARRENFVDGPAKREDLKDIVFSGGAIRVDSKLVLYAGTSDTEAQKMVLNDPFEKYEKLEAVN